MGLLEREAELDTLSRLFTVAAGGQGGVALVSGEAGIGKTSLVGAAVAALPARARVLRGACDDLIAPRSFGPLRDAARGTAGPLAAAVAAGADRDAVFEAVFAELGGSGAAVLAATAGNPFFLAEVLANPGDTVPPTVADAVLARVTQLDPATRSRVEQLAVVVAPAARSLVEALSGGSAGLVAAERLAIVEYDGRNVVFRHDLTRRAIEASLPGGRRIALHRLVLALLAGERRRADRASTGGGRAPGAGDDQRGDRPADCGVRADRRPPRHGGVDQARGQLPPGGHPPRGRAGSALRRQPGMGAPEGTPAAT